MRAAHRSYLTWLGNYVAQTQYAGDSRVVSAIQQAQRRLDRRRGRWRSRFERVAQRTVWRLQG
jgi:hypothetical protein